MMRFVSIMIIALLLAGIVSAQNYMPEFTMEPGAGIEMDSTNPGDIEMQGGHILGDMGLVSADAYVYNDGTNIIARYRNGTVIDSGTWGSNDSEVINAAYDTVPAYGVCEVSGTITTESSIILDGSKTFIHRGKVILGCSPGFVIGRENGAGNLERAYTEIGYIYDSTKTYDAIQLKNMCQSTLKVNGIYASGGIYMDNATMTNDNIIDVCGMMIDEFGLKVFVNTTANAFEGNQIRITYISDSDSETVSNGIWFYGGGVITYNQIFTGVSCCDMVINETDGGSPLCDHRHNFFYMGISYNHSRMDCSLTSTIYENCGYSSASGYYWGMENHDGSGTPPSGIALQKTGNMNIWNSGTDSYIDFGTGYTTSLTRILSTNTGALAFYAPTISTQVCYMSGSDGRLTMTGPLKLRGSIATSPLDGDFWYNNADHKLYLRSGGATYTFSPDP